MARRNRRLLVPQARAGIEMLKAEVMRQEGYTVNPNNPDAVKYEVAKGIGVPLQPGYNGGLSTEDAGRVGGAIGGQMVREMIRRAQQQLVDSRDRGGAPRGRQ